MTRAWWGGAAVAGAAIAIAAACNPIFGIVDRSAGPTWCEQAAQANAAYCDDFDRVLATTTAQEEPQVRNGAARVSSAVASSPPNSLELTATATTGDASQTVVGKLVSFGNSPSAATGSFRCRIDVQPSELNALGQQGNVMMLALGGEVANASASTPPEFIFVSVGPGGALSAQLASVGTGDVVTTIGEPCPVGNTGGIDNAWVTLEVMIRPLVAEGGLLDAAMEAPCPLGTKDEGTAKSVAVIQLGPFERAVRVRQTFIGQALVGYGIVIPGPSPGALTLHVDNAACEVLDGGP